MTQLIQTILNTPAAYAAGHHLSPVWTIALIFLGYCIDTLAIFIATLILAKAAQYVRIFISHLLKRFGIEKEQPENVFLELTFPSDTTKSAFATEQLHILLHNQAKPHGLLDTFTKPKQRQSLKIVSTREEGIRYIIVVPKSLADTTRRNFASFLPGIKVKEVGDYLPAPSQIPVQVVELGLSADFVLPLRTRQTTNEHDPIAFLTGHMTELVPGEQVAFQIVATPVTPETHPDASKRINKFKRSIGHGEALSPLLTEYFPIIPTELSAILMPPLWLLVTASKFAISIPIAILGSSTHVLPILQDNPKTKQLALDPYEQELSLAVKTKLDQHLFEVSMRLLVAAPSTEDMQDRISALVSSFQPFASTYQSIQSHEDATVFPPDTHYLTRFQERTVSPLPLNRQTVLSGSELSDLYHFPNTELTKTEGLVKSRSRELPVPLSLRQPAKSLDVIVGINAYGGERLPIGMSLEQRQKHTYIIGKTGMGKTTLLTSSIHQDMVSGKGLAVLDPHGDMFRELLEIVPEHRRNDVVVFDPTDRQHPIGLNILDPGVNFHDIEEGQEWITSAVLSVFAKLADAAYWGPRMEHILRSVTLTALQLPHPTLYTLQRLLTDKKYQRKVAASLSDPVLKQFWQKEFAVLGERQIAALTAPLTHRLGHFITTKMSRHILLQTKSTISMSDIMDEGKILLVNLSKGDIGEDQSFFFGTMLTSFMWMAAYQRTKIPESERRDFFVYVDEFQNFATPQFADIASEGRKFHVSLIVSHQNIAQIEQASILKTMTGNVANLISFKANAEDERFMLPYMKPEVTIGDIVNLVPHRFFMKTSAAESEDAFSGMTVPLNVERSPATSEQVRAYSREHYAVTRDIVEQHLALLFAAETTSKPKKTSTSPSHSSPPSAAAKTFDFQEP